MGELPFPSKPTLLQLYLNPILYMLHHLYNLLRVIVLPWLDPSDYVWEIKSKTNGFSSHRQEKKYKLYNNIKLQYFNGVCLVIHLDKWQIFKKGT